MNLNTDIDFLMLASDSIIAALSVYLTYAAFKLLKILKDNQHSYKFGSIGWWHWVEHTSIAALVFLGSIGRSMLKIVHTVEQAVSHIPPRTTLENIEIGMDAFTSLIIIGFIIAMYHIIAEEIKDGKFEHTPANSQHQYKNIINKSEMCRRISDNKEEIQNEI